MIGKIHRSKNFMATLQYVSRDDALTPLIVNLSCTLWGPAGYQEIAKGMDEMAWHSRSQRPCLHVSLSPEKEDHLSKGDWAVVAADYARGMGLDDHQLAVYLHHDATYPDGTERPHAHLVINLVGVDGRQADVYGNYYRSQDVLRGIEEELGLEHRPSWWEVARDKAIAKEEEQKQHGDAQGAIAAPTPTPETSSAPTPTPETSSAPTPRPEPTPESKPTLTGTEDTAMPPAPASAPAPQPTPDLAAAAEQQHWVEAIAPRFYGELQRARPENLIQTGDKTVLLGQVHSVVWDMDSSQLALFRNDDQALLMRSQRNSDGQWQDLGSQLNQGLVEHFQLFLQQQHEQRERERKRHRAVDFER